MQIEGVIVLSGMTRNKDSVSVYRENLFKLAVDWANLAFNTDFPTDEWIVVKVGGSLAKGTADFYSDIDLCVLYSEALQERVIEYIKKTGNLFDNVENRMGYQMSLMLTKYVKIDLHLTGGKKCENIIYQFSHGADTSSATQDYLWNIRNGITCFQKGNVPDFHVSFNASVKRALLIKYTAYLNIHRLDINIFRKDYFQTLESILTISKVLICIGYSLNNELFWGYKNAMVKINSFSPEVRDPLMNLKTINEDNWKTKIVLLKEQLLSLNIKLENLIKYG